jgi:two-component system chemotaxis response regulator CheY
MKEEYINKEMKILVVDDFPAMRSLLRGMLQGLGFSNIEEAEDGKIALDKIQSEEFNFIISDWNMPNMMGMELLFAVRAGQTTKALPFLLVTPKTQEDKVREKVNAEATALIVKPFTAETIESKIVQIFSGQ